MLVHSLLGCFFYGVFTAKMLALPRKGLPGWTLPLLGGGLFAALVGLWLTSSLWFLHHDRRAVVSRLRTAVPGGLRRRG
ncbi:DUF6529 family protein [Nonomuraea dietziae]|uniref:DUF6529 family protein n=1 Tax=Nonomuraea dietziae TaxID=65515 RepID=UPI0031E166AF